MLQEPSSLYFTAFCADAGQERILAVECEIVAGFDVAVDRIHEFSAQMIDLAALSALQMKVAVTAVSGINNAVKPGIALGRSELDQYVLIYELIEVPVYGGQIGGDPAGSEIVVDILGREASFLLA